MYRSVRDSTLVAYARGILGSRKIERACRENMVFIALTCGQVPDHSTIATFVSSMKEEIGPLFRDILLVCEEMGVDAYIPDVNFRKRDPRFETQRRHKSTPDRFTLEDFTYDEARDIFICPKGRELILRAKRARAGNRFFRRYVIKDGDCTGCEFFSKCLEKKRGGKRRQLHVRIEKKETLHTLMMLKIDTLKGRKTYEKRLGMVEPVYANIRTHKRLDRFTLRGKVKVNIQWKLYWMVHNIEKLVRAGYAYGTN
jgi:hypothetical protein